jgi:NAD(P)H-hydrate epimerase
MGTEETDLLQAVIKQAQCPLVIDADGLNMLANMPSLFSEINVPCVITPHPMEMSRLTGLGVKEITGNPIKAACDFAVKHQIHVLLKGARTVIALPDGNAVLNTTGSASLAKAGTGDVLAGMLAGLTAQGLTVGDAAIVGAYLHGKAGEKLPLHSARAWDLTEALADVTNDL